MKKIPARLRYLIFGFVWGLLLIVLLLPVVANAQSPTPCPTNQTITEVGCLPTDPIEFVASFYGIGLGLIGGVALLFVIIGGYTIMTSRGNPEQVNTGKSYIFYAILGLLLAIFGYFFIEVFLVDILHLPGFSH